MLFAEISEVGWATIASMFASFLAAITALVHAIMSKRDATEKDVKLNTINVRQEEAKTASVVAAAKATEAVSVQKERAEKSEEQSKLMIELVQKTDDQTAKLDDIKHAVNGPTTEKHSAVMDEIAHIKAELKALKEHKK